MPQFLMVQLHGSMQSWGEIAVGEVRGSSAYPTRSGAIGLLAASLGYRRDEEEKIQALNKDLGFAVRFDAGGTLLRDYHTTQVPAKPAAHRMGEVSGPLSTVLSSRDYRQDALFTAAFWSREGQDLQPVADALLRPIFTPYLGRKSCPLALPPFRPGFLLEQETLIDAWAQIRFPWALRHLHRSLNPTQKKWSEAAWDLDAPLGSYHRGDHIGTRRDVLIASQSRRFAQRREVRGQVPAAHLEEAPCT